MLSRAGKGRWGRCAQSDPFYCCKHATLQLAPPLPLFLSHRSANDCQRATFTGFNSSACLCNTTLPYLHCNALAAVEAAAAIEAALSTTAVAVDPGGWVGGRMV